MMIQQKNANNLKKKLIIQIKNEEIYKNNSLLFINNGVMNFNNVNRILIYKEKVKQKT